MVKVELTTENLTEFYLDLKNSPKELAKIFKKSEGYIRFLLKKAGINLRAEDEITKKSKKPITSKSKFSQVRSAMSHFRLTYSKKSHNAILPHNKNETDKHFLAKCVLFKVLKEKDREVFTEVVTGKGITDVLDISQNICYELETNPTDKTELEKQALVNKGFHVRVIDLRKLPLDWTEMKAYFKKIT
jgi:hypothetical protein